MTQAVLFTALIPIALLGVLGIVLVSGKLSPVARTTVERVMTVLMYGTLIIVASIRAGDYARDADWLMVTALALAAGCFAVNGFLALRRGRLFQPRAAAR